MEYLTTGLILLILGNLIKAEVDIAGIKKDIRYLARQLGKKKGGKK